MIKLKPEQFLVSGIPNIKIACSYNNDFIVKGQQWSALIFMILFINHSDNDFDASTNGSIILYYYLLQLYVATTNMWCVMVALNKSARKKPKALPLSL